MSDYPIPLDPDDGAEYFDEFHVPLHASYPASAATPPDRASRGSELRRSSGPSRPFSSLGYLLASLALAASNVVAWKAIRDRDAIIERSLEADAKLVAAIQRHLLRDAIEFPARKAAEAVR